MTRGVFERTAEMRARMSKAQKGRTIPEERKKRISETLKEKYRNGYHRVGTPMSEEIREKIAEKNRGKNRTEETKERMRQNSARYWKGKKRSPQSPETLVKTIETKRLNRLAREQAKKDMKAEGYFILKDIKRGKN